MAAVLAVGGVIAFVMKSGDKESEGIVSSAPEPAEPKESSPSKGEPIDLLSLIDLKSEPPPVVGYGTVEKDGTALVMATSSRSAVISPLPVSGGYDLDLTLVMPDQGELTKPSIILPVGPGQVVFFPDYRSKPDKGPPSRASISFENARKYPAASVEPSPFAAGQEVDLRLRVREISAKSWSIECLHGGEPVLSWEGDASLLPPP